MAAWWGIWDIIAGLAVAWVWKRRTGVSPVRGGEPVEQAGPAGPGSAG